MFEGDGNIPTPPLPPFDLSQGKVIGNLVLIPACKYEAFAAEAQKGQEANFLGWVGKIMGFETRGSKVKVKINGDKGIEHLPVQSGKFALNNLTRLS